MKKSVKILIPVLLVMILFIFTGCTKSLNHYEDKLYSEKAILGVQVINTTPTNVLTRENAIKKALDIFEKGLNVKIDRTQFSENIRLLKDDTDSSNLQWNMTWKKNNEKTFYSCTLDSSTGEVVQIQSVDLNKLYAEKLPQLSTTEIRNIITPFLGQLNINVADYNVSALNAYKNSNYLSQSTNIIITNKSNTEKSYFLTINLENKIVSEFNRLSKNDQHSIQEKINNEKNSSSRR